MTLAPPSVLIVDDQAEGRLLLGAALEGHGYAVLEASGGEEALRRASSAIPDVVLLDVLMPGLDGFETCRRLRVDPALAEVPVLLITALDDRESRLRGLEAGADDFLTRPIDPVELRARVKTITRLNRFRRLRDERHRRSQAAALSADGLVLVDEAGLVLEANDAAARIVGDALDGRTFAEALDLDARAGFAGWLAAGGRGVAPLKATLRGSGRLVELVAGAGEWEGRRVFTISMRDVTEREQLRRGLELAQRHEAVSLAQAGLAHDFGNYLMALRGGLSLIEPALPAGERARGILDDLTERLREAHDLVRRINALGRAGESASMPQALDLRDAVRGMITLLRYLTGGVRLTVSLDEAPCPVTASEPELRQILTNLVNARDAIGEGEAGEIHIAVHAGRAPAGPTLVVRDTGAGMAPEVLARVFELFFTTKPPEQGTGLGLPTTKRIIERQSGTLRLDSQPGVGTTVVVAWPAAPGAAHEHHADQNPAGGGSVAHS